MSQKAGKELENLLLKMLPNKQYATPIGQLYEFMAEQVVNPDDMGFGREQIEELYFKESEVIVKLVLYNLSHFVSDHTGLATLKKILDTRIPCSRQRGSNVPADSEVEKILKNAYKMTALYYIKCLDKYNIDEYLRGGRVGISDLKKVLSVGDLSFEDVSLTKEKYNLFLAKEIISVIIFYQRYCETNSSFFESIRQPMKYSFGVDMKEALNIIGITEKDLEEFIENGHKGRTMQIFSKKFSE